MKTLRSDSAAGSPGLARSARALAAGAALAFLLVAAGAAPASAEDGTSPSRYRIEAGDRLAIRFVRAPELDQELVVRPDGRIGLPLAPELEAAGVHPQDLATRIRSHYAKELRDPRVSVVVMETGARVFVDGQIATPGALPVDQPLTVLKAIALSGGLTPEAMAEEVLIIRRTHGQPEVTRVDLEQARLDPLADTALRSQDIVYVPKSRIAMVNQWVDQYVRRNLPISVGLRPEL